MKAKLIFLLLIYFLFITGLTFGLLTERKITRPVDIMAIGGAGITSYDKFGMLFMNPAAFALYDNLKVSLLRAGVSANWDCYNLYTVYDTLSKNGNDFSKLSSDQWKTLLNSRATIGVTGPLALGFIWEGIGFLFYNDLLTSIVVKQAPGLPYVDFGSYTDIGCLAGFGFKIPIPVFLGKFTMVYGGVTVKYIDRIKYENHRMSLLEAYDQGISVMDYKKGFLWGQAIGSDAGFMIKSEDLAFGLVLRDWFNTQFSWREYSADLKPIDATAGNNPPTYFPFQLDIGSSYRIQNVLPKYFISDLTFYLDLDNIQDFSQNFFLKTRIGFEVGFLAFMKLRGGIYQGYPTAGFALIFPFITINGAYYTEELGDIPGSIPEQNLVLEVDIVI